MASLSTFLRSFRNKEVEISLFLKEKDIDTDIDIDIYLTLSEGGARNFWKNA